MSNINNKIVITENYVKIIVTKNNDPSFYKEVFIDKEYLQFITKIRVNKDNYVYMKKDALAHKILNHTSNKFTVVDHINSNRLDNRKNNLRIVSQKENANNRNFNKKNNTGIVGISYRVKGKYKYYRSTVSDRKTPMKGAKSKTKQYSKQFNITLLGRKNAFESAKTWLQIKQKEFNYLQKDTSCDQRLSKPLIDL